MALILSSTTYSAEKNNCGQTAGTLSRALQEGEISYKTFGDKKNPALLLVHGLDSAGITFGPIVGVLSQKFYIISVDQRGHGMSADIGEDYSLDLLAADLKALLNRLGISEVHLLGHSLGARTSLRFADLWPETVKSLIIEDMDFSARRRGLGSSLQLARSLKQNLPLEGYATREDLVVALTQLYGGDKAQAESVASRRSREQPDGRWKLLFRPNVTVLYSAYANSQDQNGEFSKLKMPVLVIYPDSQGVISDSDAREMGALLPSAKISKIPKSNHNVHGSNTQGYLKALEDFFEPILK